MAAHSTILAWKIPWTEYHGGLQSRGLQRVGHNWVTKHTYMHVPSMPTFWRVFFFFYHKWIRASVLCSSQFSRALPHESLVWLSICGPLSLQLNKISVFLCSVSGLLTSCSVIWLQAESQSDQGLPQFFSFFSDQCLKSVVSYILSCLLSYHSMLLSHFSRVWLCATP